MALRSGLFRHGSFGIHDDEGSFPFPALFVVDGADILALGEIRVNANFVFPHGFSKVASTVISKPRPSRLRDRALAKTSEIFPQRLGSPRGSRAKDALLRNMPFRTDARNLSGQRNEERFLLAKNARRNDNFCTQNLPPGGMCISK
jgi:hypothetical protein